MRIGYKHSEKTKAKLRAFNLANGIKPPSRKGTRFTEEMKAKLKGRTPWNKGLKNCRPNYKHSEETKKKIGLANSIVLKGKRPAHLHSKEVRIKISKALMGKKLSPERIEKMRLVNKGKKLSPETRVKLSMALRGDKGYWWKGGRVSLNHAIRRLYKFRDWRKSIFERDDYICQMCGERGNRIEADHIKKFSLILDENNIKTVEQAEKCQELWDFNNGRTLCVPCHKTTDTYGARGYWKLAPTQMNTLSNNL